MSKIEVQLGGIRFGKASDAANWIRFKKALNEYQIENPVDDDVFAFVHMILDKFKLFLAFHAKALEEHTQGRKAGAMYILGYLRFNTPLRDETSSYKLNNKWAMHLGRLTELYDRELKGFFAHREPIQPKLKGVRK